jgi:16S rRNA A1518/A1519 N6-dimethyltransferase RsmA/KsgA/DIM1 with predicted DNA glycosylase/AP lyase activity
MIAFQPKPSALDSAIEPDFEIITKAAFSHRRKTIENSISRHPLLGSLSRRLLRLAGIDGSKRAEQLSVQDYEHLTRTYHTMRVTSDK